MANCKTAVSILQEQCARLGMTPIYNTISQEGHSHLPKFTISCTAGSTVGTGDGVSKKSAKQAAAEAVLQQWEVEIRPSKPGVSKPDVPETKNPVGELQEHVTLLNWRRPDYEEVQENGPPHDRSFVIAVTVGQYKETGTDKSKRLAKRMAARAMLDKIKTLSIEAGTEVDSRAKRSSQAASKPSLSNTLQNAKGPHIDRLCSNESNFSDDQTCRILKLIADEQAFDVTYIDLPEPARDNLHQCLVELKTSPLVVCHGTGSSQEASRSAAARNALYYIKTMASKPPAISQDKS